MARHSLHASCSAAGGRSLATRRRKSVAFEAVRASVPKDEAAFGPGQAGSPGANPRQHRTIAHPPGRQPMMLKLMPPRPCGSTPSAFIAGGLPGGCVSAKRHPHPRQQCRWWPRTTSLLAWSEAPHRSHRRASEDTISAQRRPAQGFGCLKLEFSSGKGGRSAAGRGRADIFNQSSIRPGSFPPDVPMLACCVGVQPPGCRRLEAVALPPHASASTRKRSYDQHRRRPRSDRHRPPPARR